MMVHELFSVDIMVISLICNQQDCTREGSSKRQEGVEDGRERERERERREGNSQTGFLRVSLCVYVAA